MATRVIIYMKTPEGYNEVSPPSEEGKRVIFDSGSLDATFVVAAELELELELEVVSAARDNVVVVRCLIGEVLRRVMLEILLPLEETGLEEIELEEIEPEEEEAELEGTKLDTRAPETWGALSFDPHISARAVSLTL